MEKSASENVSISTRAAFNCRTPRRMVSPVENEQNHQLQMSADIRLCIPRIRSSGHYAKTATDLQSIEAAELKLYRPVIKLRPARADHNQIEIVDKDRYSRRSRNRTDARSC